MDLRRQCEDDNDCGVNYYCYKTSNLCVNFTKCLRYNREEGTTPARSAAQCGACMKGYVTEILADGTERSLCQKNVTDVKYYLGSMMDQTTTIWMSVIYLILITSATVLLYCFMKTCRFRNWCDRINCLMRTNAASTDVVTINTTNIDGVITASAPLEEQSPFIELAENKYHVQNNNRPVNNEYQNARVSVPPQWEFVPPHGRRCAPISNANRIVPHFDNNAPDANVSNEGNIIGQLQDNIPDNQSNMQLTIELPEINIEQEDNARNTTLLQAHSSDSDTNSSPESSKRNNDNKKSNIIINQSINQNIRMNVKIP